MPDRVEKRPPSRDRVRARGGPGWLVAAAFIGPGTVTTATVAGVRFGSALLWTLVLSTLGTLVLQEMSARLGLASGRGLGEAIRTRISPGLPRTLAVFLILAAIAGGNAAYQTGNLLGAALGLEGAFGGSVRIWAPAIGALAGLLLWTGSYRALQGVLTALVGVMSLTFLATAIALRPSAMELLGALMPGTLPEGSLLLVIGLVGTTIVPYNLFLHASAVRERWGGTEALPEARRDLFLSIVTGGAVSCAILLTAAGSSGSGGEGGVTSAAEMARSLEPVLGGWARVLFAVGLFAAGMTSAVTAPLAASWAVAGVLGWPSELRDLRLRVVWGSVLLVGMVLAAAGIRPVPAILAAQAANGLLLPAVAFFLLVAVNDPALMGAHRNRTGANLLGAAVVLLTLLLGLRGLAAGLGIL